MSGSPRAAWWWRERCSGDDEPDTYQRTAPLYDFLDQPFERKRYAGLRPLVLDNLGGWLFDAGVGTGGKCAYYPPGADVAGIDTSLAMLARARLRCPTLVASGKLHQMDVPVIPRRVVRRRGRELFILSAARSVGAAGAA